MNLTRRLRWSKVSALHALEWGAAIALASGGGSHLEWRMVACGLVAAVSMTRMGRALAKPEAPPVAIAAEHAPPVIARETPAPAAPTPVLVEEPSPSTMRTTIAPGSQGRRGAVLLAEDDPDNQALFAAQLRRGGYTVTIAGNGRAAVDLAMAAVRAGEPFDLIYMDMSMPEIDGYAATRELRDKGYVGSIVALTAHAVPGDRERCLDAGCDDYRSKPINRGVLIDTARDYIELSRKTIGDADTVARRVEMPTSNEPLVSELAGDADMADILAEFVRILGTRAAMLRTAFASNDREGMQRVVHQLKGAAGGYGFPMITEQAKAVEDAMAIAGDGKQVKAAVDALCSMCVRAQMSGEPAESTAAA